MTDDTAVAALPRRSRRGSETRQRTALIAVRLTAAEAVALAAAADRAGLSVAAYLRTVALGRPGPRAARRPPIERVELARLLGQLGHVGSNLNQLARAANSGVDPDPAGLSATVAEVRTAARAVMKALGRRPA